jgi:hypothetical protein
MVVMQAATRAALTITAALSCVCLARHERNAREGEVNSASHLAIETCTRGISRQYIFVLVAPTGKSIPIFRLHR